MIVVADTSPLNYLIWVECDRLFHDVYGLIVVPAGVMQELDHARAPSPVRAWLARLPGWVEVQRTVAAPDPGLSDLGLGEQEAIQLAEEQHADLLLIDERKGRQAAKRRGLRTTGTLGVLLAAGQLHLTDPETV
ncbi:MAG: DUF3368 domain-containing protein, partial [Bryobacteraceae bacterium]